MVDRGRRRARVRKRAESSRAVLGALLGLLTLGALAAVLGSLANAASAPRHVQDARASAASTGREIPAMRTEFSQTRLLPNGNYETAVSSTPLHYRDGAGEWRKIDASLSTAADGSVVNGANAVDVTIPETADGDVRFSDGESSLSFALAAADDDATVAVERDVAEFEDAVGGVDVSYEVTGKVLKESLTLPSRDAASVYRFDVESEGLSPRLAASGAVVFEDDAGRSRLGFAAPWMRDAEGAVSRAARYEIERDGERSRIVLRLDQGWLDDAARRYPVIVDPTVYGDTEHMCEIRSGSRSNTTYCDGAVQELWVGRDANGIVYRNLFELEDLTEAVPDYVQVVDSWFAVYLDSQTPVEPSEIDLHHLTRGFAPGATWNRSDGRTPWSRPGGDFDPQREARRSTDDTPPDGWIGLDMTELAERIVSGKEPSQNLLIKAADESRQHVDAFDWAEVRVQWREWTGTAARWTFQEFPLSDGSFLRFNVGNWNTTLESNDIDLESDDGRFTVGRFFNALNAAEAPGTFGKGSRGDFGTISLERNWQDGSYLFEGPGADDGVFHKRSDGTFTPPRGFDATLVENVDGTVTVTFDDATEIWSFDRSGRLVQTRQDTGYAINGTYGPNGIATLSDTLGSSATFAYDANGDMRTITDELSLVHRYAYDGQHRLTSYTAPTGAETTYAYDLQGRLQRITLPDRSAVRIGYHSTSLVAASVTPIDASGVDQPATYFGGGYDWSVVEAPGAPKKTYFHDPYDLVVDLVQTGSDAAIATSGLIPSLNGAYTRGDVPLTVDVSAAQDPDGIQLTELEVDGVEVDSVGDAPCDETTCPRRARSTLTYDSSFDPDGTYEFRVNTVDGDDERSYSPTWTVHLDRTPPTPATEIAFVGLEADGDAAVIWSNGEDPAAPDATPGSGLAASEVRYRLAPTGVWSAWEDARDETLAIPGAAVGQQYVVEVRQRDAVGNEAPVASETMLIQDPIPGNNQSVLFELDENGEPIWPEPEPSARAVVPNCWHGTAPGHPAFTVVSDDHPRRPRNVDDVMLRATGWYLCTDPGDTALIHRMKLRVSVRMYGKDGDYHNQVWDADTDTARGTYFRRHAMVLSVNLLCRPGIRSYRMWVDGTAWYDGGAIDLSPTGREFGVYNYRCNDARAWVYQATHTPDYNEANEPNGWRSHDDIRVLSSPSATLGAAMDDPPTTTGGWAAHHIVAARGWTGRNSDASAAAAYACGIDPNGPANGVWLRGHTLDSGTPGWDALRPLSLRNYAYHPSVHSTVYFNALAARLAPLVTTWPEDCRDAMRRKLNSIRNNLKKNRFPYRPADAEPIYTDD